MKKVKLTKTIPTKIQEILDEKGFTSLRPSQIKSIEAGLFENKNLLVCTPTASGKTLVGELAALHNIYAKEGKALYVVPLRALATEKYKQFKKAYPKLSIGISSGEAESNDKGLEKFNLIVMTSEKLDSLLRHHTPWMRRVKTVIFDEIHLLNDQSRGPTLEIVITILRQLIPNIQLIGLSATIGNPKELAAWLEANLVIDTWRPTTLHKGIHLNDEIHYET